MDIDDIKNYIVENGFGMERRDFGVWSNGIKYAYNSDPEMWEPYIQKALQQAATNDYGGFYEYDETPTPGNEYYLCESPIGNDINTGIIIHREMGELKMYFQFER